MHSTQPVGPHREPVLAAAAVAGLVVSLLSAFNVVLDLGTVETIVASVIPLITAVLARGKVTPVA